MKVLAISGSIRDKSTNTALLKAIHHLLPISVEWVDFKINELPFFDPQIQFGQDVPKKVEFFRHLAHECDYIVISTPEYAHGIPGILKNALEWLICEETIRKKVIVFVASPSGGAYVKEYLLETLRTMDMVVSEEMTFIVQIARNNISTTGEISDHCLKIAIIDFLNSVGLNTKEL